MINRANARLRMGDLVIESGVFKVSLVDVDAPHLASGRRQLQGRAGGSDMFRGSRRGCELLALQVLKKKLDEEDILADIGKVTGGASPRLL